MRQDGKGNTFPKKYSNTSIRHATGLENHSAWKVSVSAHDYDTCEGRWGHACVSTCDYKKDPKYAFSYRLCIFYWVNQQQRRRNLSRLYILFTYIHLLQSRINILKLARFSTVGWWQLWTFITAQSFTSIFTRCFRVVSSSQKFIKFFLFVS